MMLSKLWEHFCPQIKTVPFGYYGFFSGTVLVLTFVLGWYFNNGDMAFGRLAKIPFAGEFHWYHVLPPVVIIFLTRKGVPVSTTFLILSVFFKYDSNRLNACKIFPRVHFSLYLRIYFIFCNLPSH